MITVYVALAGPPLLLIALLFRKILWLYRAGQIGDRMGLALSGVKLRVEGREYILRNRAAIYAVNHTSNVEPPLLFRAFDLAGFVPLERGNRDQSLPAIDRAAESLRAANSFMIFPEGTRSRTGALLPFKKGGFIMAIKAQAPIVPTAIIGAREAMHKGSLVIQPVTVTVRFGAPVETTGLTLEDRDQLVALVRRRIQALLEEG